jgi:hypothetical protein
MRWRSIKGPRCALITMGDAEFGHLQNYQAGTVFRGGCRPGDQYICYYANPDFTGFRRRYFLPLDSGPDVP